MIILHEFVRRADYHWLEAFIPTYRLDPRSTRRICDVSIVPRYKILDAIGNCNRDMGGVFSRHGGHGPFVHQALRQCMSLLCCIKRPHRLQHVQSISSSFGITLGGLIEHQFRRYELKPGRRIAPPVTSTLLTSRDNDIARGAGGQITDYGSFDVYSWFHPQSTRIPVLLRQTTARSGDQHGRPLRARHSATPFSNDHDMIGPQRRRLLRFMSNLKPASSTVQRDP